MYAFAAEVVNKINITVLRERIDSMIVKRLKGELSICDQCVLHCKENEMVNFEIDMSKL
jgi:Fe-S cluster assembly protein SufD